jgi:hypothetical protein
MKKIKTWLEWHLPKWFFLDWYKYLFAPRADKEIPWLTVVKCRSQGHPCGVVWYNVCGYEPDMTCKDCGDDLG